MKKNVPAIALFYRGPQHEAREYFSSFVPTGFFNVLRALLDEGFDARLYNVSGLSKRDLGRFIKDIRCDHALISSFYGNHHESCVVASLVKKFHPSAVTILGGPIAIIGDRILRRFSDIDHIIQGEGERSVVELVRRLQEGRDIKTISGLCFRDNSRVHVTPPVLLTDIDKYFFLPSQILPYCDGVSPENLAVLISSRGCPYKCSFCSSPVLWKGRIRRHDPRLLIRYLKDLRKTTGARYFSMRDDNFLSNREQSREFMKLLKQEKLGYLWNTQSSAQFIDDETARMLHESGCDQVQIGIETAAPRLLRSLRKNISLDRVRETIAILRKHHIRPFGYFIAGMNETEEEVRMTTEFIRTSGIMEGVLSPLVIYPGTELAEKMPDEELFAAGEIRYYSKRSFVRHGRKYASALAWAAKNNTFSD